MKFAVLTKKDDSFSLIQECFAEDEIICEHIKSEQSWTTSTLVHDHILLLIDAQFFSTHSELVALCKKYSNGVSKIIVFGCFSDRVSMSEIFNAGVNDVLVGDIDCNEMYLRTLRMFKYAKKNPEEMHQNASLSVTLGAYFLCAKHKLLSHQGKQIDLNKREFAMAWLFFSAPGTFFSKQKLAQNIWDNGESTNERTIERHINTLRKKLGIAKDSPIRLRTIYSLGYKLEVSDTLGLHR